MGLLRKILVRGMGRKKLPGTMVIGIVALGIILSAAGCGGGGVSATGIKATWVTVTAVTNGLSLPLSVVKNDSIVHFRMNPSSPNPAYMAYELDGKLYVRSNICPPCRSIGFSLVQDILVCDTCGTRFNAKTGNGISGGCVNFPKAQVPYQTKGDQIILQQADLKTAYENTLAPGWP